MNTQQDLRNQTRARRRTAHRDVGAYALGALDRGDRERFEGHLATCGACVAELASLLPVVDILSNVDKRALIAAEAETASPRSAARSTHLPIEHRKAEP